MRIGPIDSAIIVIYLLATVLLGLWVGRRRNVESAAADYFLGSRQLPWWALLLSIVATETSTASFLSVPGLSFATGGNLSFLQLALGFVLGRVLVAWVLLPMYFRGELFTSYELLEQRLGAGTRRLSSLLFLATRTLGDALRLFLTALVLHNVVRMDLSLCIAAVGAVTIVYTLFGGLRSVVWNDCAQFVVYIGGAMWALTLLVSLVPGHWSGLWDYAVSTGKLTWFVWPGAAEVAGYSFPLGVVGGTFLALASHGTDHLIVQRLLGSRSQRDAAKALILSGVVVFAQFALFLVIGIALAYFYATYPPSQEFASRDEVFASFIVDNMQSGVVGVILASIFAAAMSTQSSSLNASAGAAVNDFYRPLVRPQATDAELLAAGKLATLGFGIAQVGVALAAAGFAQQRSTVDSVLQVAAFAYGPVLGLFFLAVVRERSVHWVGFASFCIGLTTLIALKLLSLTDPPRLEVHGLWYTAIGATVTCGAGWLLLGLASWRSPGPGS